MTTTTAYLFGIGRRIGISARRSMQRQDHSRHAEHPDSYFPRFAEEAASISWGGYARLLAGMRLQDFFAPGDWAAIAQWPVCMEVCSSGEATLAMTGVLPQYAPLSWRDPKGALVAGPHPTATGN